jgi:predicted helicase
MTISQYIDNLNQRYKLGNATEHTFRGDLQTLIESLVPSIQATNEPKRQSCGAPDYILTKKDISSQQNGIPIGFIEAKDIGDKDLAGIKKTGNKEQFDRYKASLNNLFFTDYLDFHLYRDGQIVTSVKIAELVDKPSKMGGALFTTEIKPIPENFATFENLIKDFCSHIGQTIKSSKKLAEMMAGKARLLSDIIDQALTSDETNKEDSTLKDQMLAFRQILIHDITPKGFADVYAQTIAYGMFAARLHDPTLPTFSRQEAAELIPKSNPFLRKLFGYIAGPDLDDRIKWIVDSLVEIFLACNVAEILKNYGKTTKMEDPIIHFYETFLSEYDPKLRKARGVWYTPAPVVNFIVRAVDDILKTEFGLPQGLADNSKTKIKVDVQGKKIEQEVHKVQILDPATGTGTFLAEVVKHIYKKFEGQQGIWSKYVETHLLPRLNGFELLMASYAMAHLQLDLLLTETGYRKDVTPNVSTQRLRVYLTNSLEESHPDTGTLFANWLSSEANEANHIKRDAPVMCVIGNPPYSGESANKGEWIMKLMEDYKKEPGGKEKLKERNPKWINDDYVKFLRYGQHFIEKNGSGVLAFINPHGFLDNPTFRGMRWNLLKTYDKIYTIDLHGNAKKKETAPDGSVDVNVFDIMQGVSINIFVKTGKKKTNELGKVFHFDLYGKREKKYDFLAANSVGSIGYKELPNIAPDYFFVHKDFDAKKSYDVGFALNEIFFDPAPGFVTCHDQFAISLSKNEAEIKINKFLQTNSYSEAFSEFKLCSTNQWNYNSAKSNLLNYNWKNEIAIINYRPFDERYTVFTSDVCTHRRIDRAMKHLYVKKNIGLIFVRQIKTTDNFDYIFITNKIFESSFLSNKTGEITYVAPLYLYPDNTTQQTIDQRIERKPNLNTEIVNEIAKKLGLTFVADHEKIPSDFIILVEAKLFHEQFIRPNDWGYHNCFTPIDLLDYIYAVLHSPTYREKYKEFLKIDFPRVPYPKDVTTFWELVNLGGQIRELHLLESPIVEKYITQYPIDGNNVVTKIKYEACYQTTEGGSTIFHDANYEIGRVYINDTQYFELVPEHAWRFFIGGYQPAQKWLKDRKGRTLEFDDILHYQKIIVALTETARLMKEIENIHIH